MARPRNYGGPPTTRGDSAASGKGTTGKAVVVKDGYRPALGGSKLPHPDTLAYRGHKASNDGSSPGDTSRC